MPRRPPVAVAALLLLASCGHAHSGAADVRPQAGLDARERAVCGALIAALPATVSAGARRRTASPDPRTTAAWGDPPITLVCGVPTANPLDDVYEFDAVRWSTHDTGSARTWTTVGGRVHVRVSIPDAYDDQAELLGGLTPVLTPLR